jgi:competence protein ComEA
LKGLRERLSSLSRGETIGLALVVAVTLIGSGLWYVRSLPRPVSIAAAFRSPAGGGGTVAVAGAAVEGTGTAASSTTASPSPLVLIVDVAGWVRSPGVYELHQGDRIVDAIDAAGGAKKGAGLISLNLAALLTDGQQVLVPPPAPPGSTSTGIVPGTTTAGGQTLVNINTADETQLEGLDGVGPVLAQRIIDYRTEHGRFTSVDQLDDVSGIGPATLESLRPQVTI